MAYYARYFKVCSKCNRERELTWFARCSSNKDGFRGVCNLCLTGRPEPVRRRRRAGEDDHTAELLLATAGRVRLENGSGEGVVMDKVLCPGEIVRETDPPLSGETKVCGRCGHHRPLEAFGFNRGAKSGRQSYCRVCKAEYDEQYRRKKIEGVKIMVYDPASVRGRLAVFWSRFSRNKG